MSQTTLPMSDSKNSGLTETKYGTVEYKSGSKRKRMETLCRQNLLAIVTFSSVLLAVIFGIVIRSLTGKWSERSLMYLEFPGDIFLRMLKCLILPLIISSLISALGSLDTKLSGHIGRRAVIYYFTTTVLAIFLGLINTVITIGFRSSFNSNLSRHQIQESFWFSL